MSPNLKQSVGSDNIIFFVSGEALSSLHCVSPLSLLSCFHALPLPLPLPKPSLSSGCCLLKFFPAISDCYGGSSTLPYLEIPSVIASSPRYRVFGLSTFILRFPSNFVRQLNTKARHNCSNIACGLDRHRFVVQQLLPLGNLTNCLCC